VIQYSFVFYVQGAFKPCGYGVKLKVEFVVLNHLIDSLQAQGGQAPYGSGASGGLTNPGDELANTSGNSKRGWWLRLVNVTSSSKKTGREWAIQGPRTLAWSISGVIKSPGSPPWGGREVGIP
jgi:hypothetical protein